MNKKNKIISNLPEQTPEQLAEAVLKVSEYRADHQKNFFDDRVEGIAKRLEQLAKYARDINSRRPNEPMGAVKEIQHEILWGIANLHLDELVSDADRLVQYRAMLEKARSDYCIVKENQKEQINA